MATANAVYHFNKETGKVGICRAAKRCPFGEFKEHFPTRYAAQKAYEAHMNAAKWEPKKKDDFITIPLAPSERERELDRKVRESLGEEGLKASENLARSISSRPEVYKKTYNDDTFSGLTENTLEKHEQSPMEIALSKTLEKAGFPEGIIVSAHYNSDEKSRYINNLSYNVNNKISIMVQSAGELGIYESSKDLPSDLTLFYEPFQAVGLYDDNENKFHSLKLDLPGRYEKYWDGASGSYNVPRRKLKKFLKVFKEEAERTFRNEQSSQTSSLQKFNKERWDKTLQEHNVILSEYFEIETDPIKSLEYSNLFATNIGDSNSTISQFHETFNRANALKTEELPPTNMLNDYITEVNKLETIWEKTKKASSISLKSSFSPELTGKINRTIKLLNLAKENPNSFENNVSLKMASDLLNEINNSNEITLPKKVIKEIELLKVKALPSGSSSNFNESYNFENLRSFRK